MTIQQYLSLLRNKTTRMKNREVLTSFLDYKFDGGNLRFNAWCDRNIELISEK